MAEISKLSKLHLLGMRLLSNPNKYGCEQLLLNIEYSKPGVVGAFWHTKYSLHLLNLLYSDSSDSNALYLQKYANLKLFE